MDLDEAHQITEEYLMDWKESVEEIKKAQENNQLVLFVGAGVSKNSGVPTWWELVKKIAEKIGYDKCTSCKRKKEDCFVLDCEERYDFTQEELLRIPEYYYQSDTSENHREYYDLIGSTLKCDRNPNPIDEEIFNILPHHIITTNYDPLLERTFAVNSRLYKVVAEDSDLLSKTNERYIIKMQGDLNSPRTIVLKESDYINYEQEHPLISTFIRSLLINHIFVFLGYSLNDYNLNLIIGWINYFRKNYGVEKRVFNFLVNSDGPSGFEEKRLEEKNIYVVDLTSLPDNIVTKASAPASLHNPIGKKLYSFLRCITDWEIFQQYLSIPELLAKKYQVLKSYRKISFEDLIGVCALGRTVFKGTELIFYDKEWYEQIATLLDSREGKVIDTFQRAGLTGIQYYGNEWGNDLRKSINLGINDEYFALYIDNDYIELSNQVQGCPDPATKIYYYHLFGKNGTEMEEVIATEESCIEQNDYIAILLHKMRVRLTKLSLIDRQDTKTKELKQLFDTAPVRYYNAINYLKVLFESSANNMLKMEQIVQRQEKRYEYKSNSFYSGHSFTHIWDLQSYAYDYYFFFKGNSLPFDYFKNPQSYLEYYLKAILCSYSPVNSEIVTIGFFPTDRRHYVLNEIDLDMFIKYIEPKALKSLLQKYSVQFLEMKENINIALKYKNLCSSLSHFKNRRWIANLYNFTIIICLVRLDDNSRIEIFAEFADVFKQIVKSSPAIGVELIEIINYFVKNLVVEDTDKVAEAKAELLDALLLEDFYPMAKERHGTIILMLKRELASYIKEETKAHIIAVIDAIEDKGQKVKEIVSFRHLLPMEPYTAFLNDNFKKLDIHTVFQLLTEGILPYSDMIFDIFIHIIENMDSDKEEDSRL